MPALIVTLATTTTSPRPQRLRARLAFRAGARAVRAPDLRRARQRRRRGRDRVVPLDRARQSTRCHRDASGGVRCDGPVSRATMRCPVRRDDAAARGVAGAPRWGAATPRAGGDGAGGDSYATFRLFRWLFRSKHGAHRGINPMRAPHALGDGGKRSGVANYVG